MGGSCFRPSNNRGDLLPADSQGEISERHEALRRQEHEISEKRRQYAALGAALEEERKKGANAKKELREVLAESEEFKTRVKELSAQLKACEVEVGKLEGNKAENEQLLGTIQQLSSADSSAVTDTELNRLQTEIITYLAQLPALEADHDRLKSESDSYQQRLRETEAAISLLEESEIHREQALGEEVSLQEVSKRREHVRVLCWLAVRKVLGVKQKYVAVWRYQAWTKRQVSIQRGAIDVEMEGFARKIAGVSMADMEECTTLIALLRERMSKNTELEAKATDTFAPLAKLTAEMTNLLSAVGERAEALAAEFTDDEDTLRVAAEVEVLSKQQTQLQALISAVKNAIQYLETTDKALADSQLLNNAEESISQAAQLVDSLLQQLSSIESDLRAAATKHEAVLIMDQKGKIGRIMEEIAVRSKTYTKQREQTAEGLQLLPAFELSMTGLRTSRANCPKSPSQLALIHRNLQDLLSKAEQSPPSLHPKSSPILEETSEIEVISEEEVVEAMPVEMEVASGNPDESPTLAEGSEDLEVDWSVFTEEEKMEIMQNPARMILKQTQKAEVSQIPAEEIMQQIRSFFTSETPLFSSNTPFPRISALLLEHFLPPNSPPASQSAFSSFSLTLSLLASERPDSYISLLASALGLSLPFPMSDSQAKLVSIAETLIHEGSVRLEKAIKGPKPSLEETLLTGGRLYLTDAINAVYLLFPESPAMGEIALEKIKPPSISLPELLNFMICFRLKELKLDALKLFKLIDSDNSGKLNGEEFAQGVRQHLRLWMSVDSLKGLFRALDADGSDSISRIEFAKAINLKEYYQKYETQTYTISKIEFLRASLEAIRVWRTEVALPIEAKAKEIQQDGQMLSQSEVAEVLRQLEGKFPEDYLQSVCSSVGDSASVSQLLLALVSTPPPFHQSLSTFHTARFYIHSSLA